MTSVLPDPATGAAVSCEPRRLQALHSYGVLDTPPEEDFDDLAQLAAEVCGAPMAMINLVDAERVWPKAGVNLPLVATPRDLSFCAHTLDHQGVLVVPDARLDPRFADLPAVTGAPHIRFYAGAPLLGDDGDTLGALCVVDTEPRTLTDVQHHQLVALARQVVGQLVSRRQRRDLAQELAGRRQAVEALTHSEGLLRGVLDHTDSLVYAKDLEGRFMLVNRALEGVLGRSADTLIGRSDHDLFPGDIADEYRCNDQEIIRSGTRQVFGEQLLHENNTVHDYLSTKFPLRGATGDIYGIAGVSTDITELAEKRRELADSERRWRSLVEHSPVAVAVVAADGRFAYANPKAVRLYGGARTATVIGSSAVQFVPVDDRTATEKLFAAVLGGETVLGRRWTLRQLDGALVEVELNAARVDYRGQPAAQIELRDMTAQVLAEQALRESEHRWRSLFTGSPVGIAVADHTGRIVSANEALCSLLGRPENEVVGSTSAAFGHPDHCPTLQETSALIDAAPDGILQQERRYVLPDGTPRWAWMTMTRTPGPNGEQWTLAHVADITERKAHDDSVVQEATNLTAMAAVARQIQAGGDARQTIVEAGLQLADAAYVSLLEPAADRRTLQVTSTTKEELRGRAVPLSATSATVEVFRTGRALFVADPDTHPLVSPALLELTNARSVYLMPVRANDRVIAVMVVGWDHRVPAVDGRRTTVLTLLADQAGTALRQVGLMAELELRAVTDSLTGLPNRRGWDVFLDEAMVIATRSGHPLTVAIGDIDHFKHYNDRYGHNAGDHLLRRFASDVRYALRRGDAAARWGGEEFAFALPACSAGQAALVLERVRRSVPEPQTCSIGFATWDGTETPVELMARADRAMYAAKQTGRNRVLPAEAPAHSPALRPAPLEPGTVTDSEGIRTSHARDTSAVPPA